MVKITGVEEHSRAMRAGVIAGDMLVSVNGHEINDVLDYRFYLTACHITLGLLRGEEKIELKILKAEYDDIGLDFETPLMDNKHRCENRCIFCFIDQLPRGMRKSLYFKDDDSRLSFLHGNYITLTNLHREDIDRIISMHISPVNVSVHTTNPELRVKMMKNRRAGDVLEYIGLMAKAGIKLCGQIVLCRGVNDGAELDRTMNDLAAYFPTMDSVSVVPAGLTRYREGLYPLEPFTKEESAQVIAQVNAFGDKCREKLGERIFLCADELYIKAEIPLPDEEYYGGYDQIENGVGMLTSISAEFSRELEYLDEYTSESADRRRVTIATGVAAYDCIASMAAELERRVPGLSVNTVKIINRFFGESVTVAGLLTGKDMSEQLMGMDVGDVLLIPQATLRSGEDVFLDDMTVGQLSAALGGVEIIPVANDGAEFIQAVLGIKR